MRFLPLKRNLKWYQFVAKITQKPLWRPIYRVLQFYWTHLFIYYIFMLFEKLLLLKFIFIYFDTLKDTKPLIFTSIRYDEHSRPSIYRDYFMESATYGILFTSCLYHKTNERGTSEWVYDSNNEWINPVQSTFHAIICLLYI